MQRTQYERSYPALDLPPVRREGSTGPERPQRRRPDGQECYVESNTSGSHIHDRGSIIPHQVYE